MNHYDTLGVKRNASQEDIKIAYKNLVKKYHPDIYPGDKIFAERKTKEINEAYSVLSNPETRSNYDMEIYPETTYSYTPPKYNNPSSYYYEQYYRNKNTSEFGDYDKRYTDYHRSKTPNSNYTNQKNIHDEFSDNIINSIDRLSLNKKIVVVFILLITYAIIFILTIFRFNSFNSGAETGTIFDSKKTNTTISNTIQEKNTVPNTSSKTTFNIEDYFTEQELRDVYKEYVPNEEISFSEFKQILNTYFANYNFE